MPELNLSAAVAATAAATPSPARGPAAAPDSSPSAFGDAMAQASSNRAAPNGSPAAPKPQDEKPSTRDAGAQAPRHNPGARPAKSDDKAGAEEDEATDDDETPGAAALSPEQIKQAQALAAAPAAPAAAQAAPAAASARAGTPRARDATESVTAADANGARAARRGHQVAAADAAPAAHTAPANDDPKGAPLPARAQRVDRDDAAAQARDGKHAAAIKDTLDPLPALAGGPPAAPRDRLSEDFQQRFERALAAATAAPRGDGGGPAHTAASGWTAAMPATTAQAVAQIAVPTPVGAAAFNDDFSGRVALLTRGKVHSAEISLTPADLGPVSVSIEVRGTEATLVFGAAHAATRSAIEDALPRLRDMLGAQGLQLADARVGTQSGGGSSRHDERAPHASTPASGAIAAAGAPIAAAPAVTLRSNRLIDVIA